MRVKSLYLKNEIRKYFVWNRHFDKDEKASLTSGQSSRVWIVRIPTVISLSFTQIPKKGRSIQNSMTKYKYFHTQINNNNNNKYL